jgi:putative ABC transport system substrate-binding protein
MKRRAFIISLIGWAAAARPLAAFAQKPPARLGWLSSGSATSAVGIGFVAAIKAGLRENGLIEGRDYVLEARYANGVYERFPDLARELVEARVAIIITNTIASVRAAQRVTPPVPVVMCPINDPVGNGLIASLARPGGLTTGVATLNQDLTAKMLEFQRAILPKLQTIAAMFNPGNPSNPRALDDLRARAVKMAVNVSPVALRSPHDLDTAFAAIVASKPDSLQIISDSGTLDVSDRIAAFALERRLPSFATIGDYAEMGGLLAYGPPRRKMLMKSGYYVKRILDGANPGELPVEQPSQIELSINLKTAHAIGVDIPLNFQQLADRLVE